MKLDTGNLPPDNDFAIIKLASPVTSSDYVVPACLPSASSNYDDVAAQVSGWGRINNNNNDQPDVLQKVCEAYSYIKIFVNLLIIDK